MEAGRDARNTGVWIGGRKVASIGVAIRQWVAWHGLALNVDVDLAGFQRIRPCGFGADVMTRVADHLQPCPSVDALAGPLAAHLAEALGLEAGRTVRARLGGVEEVEALVAGWV